MTQPSKDPSALYCTPDQLAGVTPEQAHRNSLLIEKMLWGFVRGGAEAQAAVDAAIAKASKRTS